MALGGRIIIFVRIMREFLLKMKLTKLSKKATTLTPNEIIELILVIAGAFLLIVLFITLTKPHFNRDEETAKSYFETLQKEIGKADSGKTGEFFIWENKRAFLVYFGEASRTYPWREDDWKSNGRDWDEPEDKHLFKPKGNYKRDLCVCYDVVNGKTRKTEEYTEDGKKNIYTSTLCKSCVSLGRPVFLEGFANKNTNGGRFVLKRGDSIDITLDKGKNVYLFKKK